MHALGGLVGHLGLESERNIHDKLVVKKLKFFQTSDVNNL